MNFFRFYIVIALLFISKLNIFAQIGINTITPDTSAALHIVAKPYGQGLLIPRLTQAQRIAITTPAKGLMVYDLTDDLYYMNLDPGVHNWYAINPWQTKATNGAVNAMYTHSTVTNVGIGTQTPTARLDVVGDIKSSTSITTNTVSANTLTVSGFPVNPLVPAGAIIMWSGNPLTLPAGWALCDGAGGRPDLRGRFIVGYDASDADYSTVTKVGPSYTDANGTFTGTSTQEAKSIKLTAAQSGLQAHTHTTAAHSHGISQIRWSNSNGYIDNNGSGTGATGAFTPSTDNATVTVNPVAAVAATAAHENRPPYYVLAYIIKLP